MILLFVNPYIALITKNKWVLCVFLLLMHSALFSQLFNNPSKQSYKIVLDAGHGGHDPGAVGKVFKEKDIALAITLELGRLVREDLDQVAVVYTRDSDVFVPLYQRAKIANEAKADLFVSIHCNHAKNKLAVGTETFVMGLHTADENLEVARRENSAILLEDDYDSRYDGYDPNSPVGHIILSSYQNAFLSQSIEFANKVENHLIQKQYTRSRGVKQAGFVVLKRVTMPAVLIEAGFLSNYTEEQILGDTSYQKEIAAAIFEAIKAFFCQKEEIRKHALNKQKEDSLVDSPITHNDRNIASGSSKYKVQFAALKAQTDIYRNSKLPTMGNLLEIEEDGLFKYQLGFYNSAEEANLAKTKLHDMGYKGAFVVKPKLQ
jgi:N-acetylmuramoyl-L-alanine amidase